MTQGVGTLVDNTDRRSNHCCNRDLDSMVRVVEDSSGCTTSYLTCL